MKPAPRKPMKTMSVPTAAWMPIFKASGTSFATFSRSFESERMRKTTPVKATMARAPCQGAPICFTIT